jgi:hypothetical protein
MIITTSLLNPSQAVSDSNSHAPNSKAISESSIMVFESICMVSLLIFWNILVLDILIMNRNELRVDKDEALAAITYD